MADADDRTTKSGKAAKPFMRALPISAPSILPPMAMDDHLCFAVYSTALAFNRVYRPLLTRLGLTYPQYLVMTILWNGADQTVSSISEKLFLDSGTITPLLKRMETAGLVQRVRCAQDQRCVRVYVTEKGKALQPRAVDVPDAVMSAAGGDNPENAALRDDLLRLRAALLENPIADI